MLHIKLPTKQDLQKGKHDKNIQSIPYFFYLMTIFFASLPIYWKTVVDR